MGWVLRWFVQSFLHSFFKWFGSAGISDHVWTAWIITQKRTRLEDSYWYNYEYGLLSAAQDNKTGFRQNEFLQLARIHSSAIDTIVICMRSMSCVTKFQEEDFLHLDIAKRKAKLCLCSVCSPTSCKNINLAFLVQNRGTRAEARLLHYGSGRHTPENKLNIFKEKPERCRL